ncbi:MAG: hypothetical protein KJ630_00105, partial [Proteobacteria bacterium]|nr:hypothetical protein [Pseudomonadota bacterium]
MDKHVAAARIKKSDFLIPLIIICALVTVNYFHHVRSQKELKIAVTEHSKLLVDPLWNFDTDSIDGFLSVLIARKEYQKVQVFGSDEKLISEIQSRPLKGLDKILFDIDLLQTREFSVLISKNDKKLGKITVFWKDASIY